MAGIKGYNSTLIHTSTEVTGVLTLGGPSESVDDIDVSTMDSPSTRREFISGLIDSGEITAEVLYVKAVYNAVQALVGAAAEIWKITLSDSTTIAASGYVKGLTLNAPFDDKVTFSMTIKLSGLITVTPGA